MNIKYVSDKLQNPRSEEDRISAWGELLEIKQLVDDLYGKYNRLEKDWTKETISG